MPRRALIRGGVATAAALALAAGAVPLLAPAADAASSTSEIVVDNPRTSTPRYERILGAGATGFLHREGGRDGLLWTSYTDSTTETVRDADGTYDVWECYYLDESCPTAYYGQSSDTVAMPVASNPSDVTLRDMTGGALYGVAVGMFQYLATYGSTVLAVGDESPVQLVDVQDGDQRSRDVSGFPDGAQGADVVTGTAGDATGTAVRYTVSGEHRIGYIDFASATLTEVFSDVPVTEDSVPRMLLTSDRIGWYTPGSGLHLKARGDLSGAETVVPVTSQVTNGQAALVGDWLVLQGATSSGGDPVVEAVPMDGGRARTLLSRAYGDLRATPQGGALVTGGTSASDWWVWRVALGGDGTPELAKVYEVAPEENDKAGLALNRGYLRVAESTGKTGVWTLPTEGALTAGTRTASSPATTRDCTTPDPDSGSDSVPQCVQLWGNSGTGGDVRLGTYYDEDTGNDADVIVSMDDPDAGAANLYLHTRNGTVVDAADGYAVYNSGGSSPKQYVYSFGYGKELERSVRAAALRGHTLWSATSTAGQITSYDLAAKETLSTVTVGASCVPSELQAAGHWVYWSCGDSGPAGVYDTVAKKSVRVTPGDVLLGDGFTVRHDHSTGALVLTDVTSGAAVKRTIATLPGTGSASDTGLAKDRRYRWTVDRYTDLVAYVGDLQQVHVVRTGVATTPLALFDSYAGDGLWLRVSGYETWYAEWTLSRPVSSWTLALTDPAGRTLRTLAGGDTRADLTTSWNGRTSTGAYAPNGRFQWTLRAVPAGAAAAVKLASGTADLGGGAAVRRDYQGEGNRPDGIGDLLTLDSSGRLAYQHGTRPGTFSGRTTGTGWPTNITVVPFGDLSGDRCNDVLVRLSSGALRAYKPGCGKAVKPSTSYVSLGNGWNAFNVLTSPGDLTGDGRADLVARKSSTGDVYLYAATSAGKLKAGVKIASKWTGYKKVVGAGDLNGDGYGDLLVQDKSNVLWRYAGTASGKFKARVKVFSSWGASYNAVVGVGDITGDGKADLVARDTSGNLYRQSGNGKGGFGARTKIATGWKAYKGLF